MRLNGSCGSSDWSVSGLEPLSTVGKGWLGRLGSLGRLHAHATGVGWRRGESELHCSEGLGGGLQGIPGVLMSSVTSFNALGCI